MHSHGTTPRQAPDQATPTGVLATPADTSPAFWAWAINPKDSALDNLLAAKRYHRLNYGGELVKAVMRSELAARLPADTAIAVEANDQVAKDVMLFQRAEVSK